MTTKVQLESDLFDARHSAEQWEESHDIERDRANAAEAEVAELRAQLALALVVGLAECEDLRAQLRVVRANYQEVLRGIPRD
jgi:hypothetical protein